MTRTRLLVASGNAKKLEELQALLADLDINLISLKDVLNVKEVEEDGTTFEENACKKALGFAEQTGCLTLADDSGISVDYLKGAPGIYSARYAGPERDDAKNCDKLLAALKGVPDEKRGGAFVCAVAVATPKKILQVVEARVEGRIMHAMKGSGGFGYDPLFFYPDFGKTFAQVQAREKHTVSHRGQALNKMKAFLTEYLKQGA
jgi:XTP/dITP diphosphohydrolase